MKMNINDIIIKPIITEKSSDLMSQNKYTLEVHPNATKTDVKKAVEVIFKQSNAKVEKINLIKVKRKPKKMGKYEGFKKGYKKVIVKLSAGTIPIYGAGGVENTSKKPKKTLKIIDTDKIMKEAEKEAK